MFFSKNLEKFNNIKHCFFSRKNGFSKGLYKSLNCGLGSRDNKEDILKNLEFVSKKIGCKKDYLITLNQTHSNKVIYFENLADVKNKLDADAIVCKVKNIAIGILTADCAPILFYDNKKKLIACAHSGWKGAFNGIIKNTLNKLRNLGSNFNDITAVIGPCINKQNYEVKIDFYNKFIDQSKENKYFFEKINNEKYYFDLRAFIHSKISEQNVKNIENIEMDTFSDSKSFYSYRRSCVSKEKDYGRCISVILMT
jgi:hypothetical protein